MSLAIELLILVLIAIEVIISLCDRKANKDWQDKVVNLLEDSTAELADIRDETVKEDA
jgi:hypothetical protein